MELKDMFTLVEKKKKPCDLHTGFYYYETHIHQLFFKTLKSLITTYLADNGMASHGKFYYPE